MRKQENRKSRLEKVVRTLSKGMKIIMASEVILKGLDPTKPYRALDSSGRLVAPPSKEVAQPAAVAFLPAPIEVEKAEQNVAVAPEIVPTVEEASLRVELSPVTVVLETSEPPKEDLSVNVNVSVSLDEKQLENSLEAVRPKGRPKGPSKKTA